MRHLARSLGFWVAVTAAAALASSVGCCNNNNASGTASNGTGGSASNGASNGNGSASNGANAGASNGANNGNGSASNGGATNGGSASNGGATNSGRASNGGATNGGSASNGGTSGMDCNVPFIITADLELTTQCPVWYIGEGGTMVEGTASTAPGAVLTIDPGVTVAVAPSAALLVGISALGGTLQVNGTPAHPVTFTSSAAQTAGSWVGIVLGDYAVGSALASTTIAYAAGPFAGVGDAQYPGALVVYGGVNTNLVTLNDITLSHNGGSGFVFAGHAAGLAPGSGNLTVSDWGAGSYPFVVDANEVGSLPTTVTAGASSGAPAVALDCQDTSDCGSPMTVDHDQTWPALGWPYLILSAAGVNVDGAGSPATLTLAAPNTLEFVDDSSLQVDALDVGQGELVAVGTAQSPIVFESIDPTPLFSAWQGLELVASDLNALASTSIAYCDISDATGFTTAIEETPGNVSGEITVNGSLATQLPDGGAVGPSIANCTFSNFGSCGIFTFDISNSDSYGTPGSGAAGNTFTPATGTAGDGDVLGDVCSI